MASAVPENERDTAGEIAIFQTATETMACYIGYLRNQIREESKQSVPNEDRIRALDEQCWSVVRERKAITLDNEALIRKALYVYAPFLKALRS